MRGSRPARLVVLGHRRDFLACAGSRLKWSSPGFVLQVRGWTDRDRQCLLKLTDGPPPAGMRQVTTDITEGDPCPLVLRIGFTASKKVGHAVRRNRARRRLKGLVQTVLSLAARPETDYVLVARSATPDIPFDRLAADLRQGLGKLGVLRQDGQTRAGDRSR